MLAGVGQRGDGPDIRVGDLVTVQLVGEPVRHVIVAGVERGPDGELVLETISEPDEGDA